MRGEFFFAGIAERLKNYGIKEEWDIDRKRSFRQVNEFNLLLCAISLSSWPIAIGFRLYLGLLIQVIAFSLYLLGIYVLKKGMLRKARLLAIYTFETHLFVLSFFAIRPTEFQLVPWYSQVFATYILYPVVAALFDKNVFKHMLIAALQVTAFQFLGGIFERSGLLVVPVENQNILNFTVTLYTLGMATLLIYLIHSENRTVKVQIIERSRELEDALADVGRSNEVIKKQAENLEKLNNAKNKFFSIIAHDLKSPYNIVLGFSEILKEKSVSDPEYNKYATHLYDTALHNYNLLDNLLEWSRAQMDHIQFRPAVFSLNEVIFKTVNLVGVSAEKKDILITNEVKNSLKVCADRNLVNIIIRNIVSNAVKFTMPGGNIVIGAANHGSMTEVFIRDNGIGMPDEVLRDLFKIEHKQSRRGTVSESGTGLGLILCKEFVEMHGGSIRAESREGEGTTFYFTLPSV